MKEPYHARARLDHVKILGSTLPFGMHMNDPHDAPTPRQSNTWEFYAKMAREVSERLKLRWLFWLRAENLDVKRARMLHAMHEVMDHYAQAFDRWPVDDTISIEQKSRERSEFMAILSGAQAILHGEADPA